MKSRHKELDRLGVPRFGESFNPISRTWSRPRLTLEERERIRFLSLSAEAQRMELCKAMGLDERGKPL